MAPCKSDTPGSRRPTRIPSAKSGRSRSAVAAGYSRTGAPVAARAAPNSTLRSNSCERATRSSRGGSADWGRSGCQLVSLTEAIDTGTPGGRLVFTVFAALAAFEADPVRERTVEAAKTASVHGNR